MEQKDFFISYNKADEKWATWTAWTLEQAGFKVVIQAWDFRPGANFVLEMQRAASEAKRTIAILSPNYITSSFTQPEWAAAFARDPKGETKTLVPVVVAECDVEGILGPIVHINLVGLEEDSAREKLIAGLEPGRAKPIVSPSFPGHALQTIPTAPSTPEPLTWAPNNTSAVAVFRGQLPSIRREGGASAIELHMLPNPPQHLPVRKLEDLKTELVDLGRGRGFFTSTEGITAIMDDELVYCQTKEESNSGKGMLVTRTGQRGAWITLPRDGLGSVLDFDDLRPRLENILQTLLTTPIPRADSYAFAIRIAPCIMLTLGSANILGVRSSATMPFAMSRPDSVDVVPEDTLDTASLDRNIHAAVDELLARIRAQFAKIS